MLVEREGYGELQQTHSIKAFGSLINAAAPFYIRQDSLAHKAAERFGTDKMLEILNDYRSEGLVGLLTEMKKQIDEFTGEMDPFDDVTMMGIKYNGEG